MKKIVWTYGLISGTLLGGMFFLMAPFYDADMDLESGELFGFIAMFIGLAPIFFALRTYRAQRGAAGLSFKKAFLSGLYMSLIASVMYGVGWMLFYHTIGDSGMMESYFQQQIENIQSSGLPQDQIDAQIQSQQEFKDMYLNNPLIMFGMTLTEILPIALIVTLISAAVWRKKPQNATS